MYLTDFTPGREKERGGSAELLSAACGTVSNRRGGNGMPDGAATYRGRYYN